MKHRHIGFVLSLCWMVTACNRPLRNQVIPTEPAPSNPSPVVTGTSEGSFSSSGETRHYRVHISPSYQDGIAVPLVVNFHGFSSNSQQEENMTGMSVKADQEGFI